MHINRVLIENLRNLKEVSVDDLAMLNFFIGPNGAGKTSLLEAVSLISQGRSFRNNKVQTVINQDETGLRVFLECTDDNDNTHKLGIQRDRKSQYLVRIDGATAATLAELSIILPTVVLDANAFDLLDGPSSIRRKFIDWGVFHVEHGFYDKWKAFNRILKQRNSLLRSKVTDYIMYEPWDMELVSLAIEIENYRLAFLNKYHAILLSTISILDEQLTTNTIFYKNGWGIERLDFQDIITEERKPLLAVDLLSALKEQFARDCKYQRTHIGPHKADIQIRVNKNDVKDIYSRGQKKTLVAAMKLAQAKVVKSSTYKRPVLLLDDLPSELDNEHLDRFLQYVVSEEYQCFITAVDDRIFKNNSYVKARMFHVERGKITPVNAQGDSQE